MLRCDDCRNRLLDFLYGLLDPDEEAAVITHLEGCPSCAAARSEAERSRRLLDAASRFSFPEVVFQPPKSPTTAAVSSGAGGRPIHSRRGWFVWSLAACLLLAIGIPATRDALRYRHASQAERDALAVLTAQQAQNAEQRSRLQNRLEAAQKAVAEQSRHWIQESVAKAKASQPLSIEVTGPASAIPGAPNEYTVQTRNPEGKPVAARLELAIVNKAGNRLAQLPPVTPIQTESVGGALRPSVLRIPPDIWAKLPPNTSDVYLAVTAIDPRTQHKVDLDQPIPLTPPVYTIFLVTDKPLYQPGEDLFFRSVTLDRTRFLPPVDELRLQFELRKPDGTVVKGLSQSGSARPVLPTGEPVLGPDDRPVRGVACGVFRLPSDLPGGEYTLVARELPAGENPPASQPVATRKILVNRYTPDRLQKTLEFSARSYGPGEGVRATVTVTDQNKPVSGARINAVVSGGMFETLPALRTDSSGKATISFTLSNKPDLSDVTLGVEVRHEGIVEPIIRQVPLSTKKLTVEFFPEGGDLIEGLPNRIYFRVTDQFGKPADLQGYVTDGERKILTTQSLTDDEHPGVNQGLGVFTLTPMPGKRYALRLVRPAGAIEPTLATPLSTEAKSGYLLPPARPDGVTLSIPQGVMDARQSLEAVVTSTRKRSLLVGVYIRGNAAGHRHVTVEAKTPTRVSIPLADSPVGGVTRVTVFEETTPEAKPLAERLCFRQPPHDLKLEFTPAPTPYTPGEKVTLEVSGKDETGQPIPAILWMAVVNQSVLTSADDKTERSLPAHFLLAGEVQKPEQLEHADFFLTSHPRAHESLDLLLGTQGWRRFAEQAAPQRTFNPQLVTRPGVREFLTTAGAAKEAHDPVEPVNRKYRQQLKREVDELASAEKAMQEFQTRIDSEQQSRMAYEDSRRERQIAERELLSFNGWAQKTLPVIVLASLAWVTLSRRMTSRFIGLITGVIGLLVIGFLALPTTRRETAAVDDMMPMTATPSPKSAAAWQPPDIPGTPGMGGPDLRETVRPQGTPRTVRAFAVPNPAIRSLPGRPVNQWNSIGLSNVSVNEAIRRFDGQKLARFIETDYLEHKQDNRLSPLERESLDRVKRSVQGPDPFVVREYAHVHAVTSEHDQTRNDFTETVYWHPLLVLPDSGKATVSFQLSDSINAYRVLIAGNTLDGRLGSVSGLIEVRKPLAVEFKLPPEMTTGDSLSIPVVVSNASALSAETTLSYWSDHLTAARESLNSVRLEAGSGSRILVPASSRRIGPARVRISASAGQGRADAVERIVSIVPDGFPASASVSDMLEKQTEFQMILARDRFPGTTRAQVTVFTNTLGSISSSLSGMLREPHGCFEQTSSSNYPNLLVLDYLQKTGTASPMLKERAIGLLDRGMRRLQSFEVPAKDKAGKEGFEWFGHYPPHEALSAYGLVQFADLARVHTVDPDLVMRTEQYLLGQRDGKGGFRRRADGHAFGAVPDAIASAYIVWAISEANPKAELSLELEACTGEAMTSGDPYRLALIAIAMQNRGQREKANRLLQVLVEKQRSDGSVPGAETSITRSMGTDLLVETTALAALAFQKVPRPNPYEGMARKAVRFLIGQRQGHGTFGATQATVLTLKALVEHARLNPPGSESGTIVLQSQGKEIARKVFHAQDEEPVTFELENVETLFKEGAVEFTLRSDSNTAYPFTASWSAMVQTPDSDPNCELKLTTELDHKQAMEGKTVRLNVRMENRADHDQGMAVAIVGLPAGLQIPSDYKQFERLTARPREGEPVLSHWELIGRQLVLYWRGLGPKQAVNVPIDLVAAYPGDFRGPASRAYLYYSPSAKVWLPPLQVQIQDGSP